MLPSPTELYRELDQTVVGQEGAKRALAMAIYKHLLGTAAVSNRIGDTTPEFGRQHILLLGPTGVGKTLLVRQLAKLLDVPVAFTSATSLVETGYVGDKVDSIIHALLSAANGNLKRALGGLVFIDEVDKVRRTVGSGKDVHGEGVQNALLPMLDGIQVAIGEKTSIHTSGLLFICAGAFVGLEELIAERLGADEASGAPNLLEMLETEDLVRFGFIPEFVGRFTTVRCLSPLSVQELGRILTDARSSIAERARKFFSLHGATVVLTEGAIAAIASRAAEANTGARGLDSVLADILRPIEWHLTESAVPIRKVVVSKECVTEGQQPQYHAANQPHKTDELAELRARAFCAKAGLREVSDTSGWDRTAVLVRLQEVKQLLEFECTTASAKKWFEGIERENSSNTALVLRFLEELLVRDATVDEFFAALLNSETPDNLAAGLHFLDYWRIRKSVKQKK